MTAAATRAGHACMFHVGRSGSTVVANQLGQHPGLVWAREMIDPRHRFDRDSAVAAVAAEVRAASPRRFGFEVKFYHLRRAGLQLAPFLEQLDRMGFDRFIVVRRRNLLRKVVSSQVARTTGEWHWHAGSEPPLRTVRIEPERVPVEGGQRPLAAIIDGYLEDFRRLERALGSRARLDLVYEDDIQADPAVAARRATAFLGLPPHAARIRLARTTPWPLHQVVENLAEVRAHLAATPHAWMADEDGP